MLKKGMAGLLLVVFLFLSVVNVYNFKNTKRLIEADESSSLFTIIKMERAIEKYPFVPLMQIDGANHGSFFPLLQAVVYHGLKAMSIQSLGITTLFVNLLLLLLLMFSTFFIGCCFFDVKTAFLGTVLMSLSPQVFSHTRLNLLDLPLAVFISISMLFLLKTRYLTSRFWVILSGIMLGISQVVKLSAFVFWGLPLIYYSMVSIFRAENRKKTYLNFFCLCSIIVGFTIVVGFCFFPHETYGICLKKALLIEVNNSIFYYPFCVFFLFFGFPLSFLLIPLCASYLVNARNRNIFLNLWFWGAMIFFLLIPNKVSRFLIPVLPAMFLLLSAEVFSFYFLRLRKMLAVILVFVAFSQYIILNFFPELSYLGGMKQEMDICKNNFQAGPLSVWSDPDVEVVDRLVVFFSLQEKGNIKKNKKKIIVFAFRNGMESDLKIKLAMKDLRYNVSCPQQMDAVAAPIPGVVDWEDYLLNADYVVATTGELGRGGSKENISLMFNEALIKHVNLFDEVLRINRSEKENILVLKNNNKKSLMQTI